MSDLVEAVARAIASCSINDGYGQFIPEAKAAINAIIEADWPVKMEGETAETHADVWRHRLEAKALLKQAVEGW